MTWIYDKEKYGENHDYPGSVETRRAIVSDMLYDHDFEAEFEEWLDREYSPHDLYGMICDAMKGLKGAESVFSELWDYFIEDMADDVEFIEFHGAEWKEEEE